MKKQILLATAALGVVLGGAGAVHGTGASLYYKDVDSMYGVAKIEGALHHSGAMANDAASIITALNAAELSELAGSLQAAGNKLEDVISGNYTEIKKNIDGDANADAKALDLLRTELNKLEAKPTGTDKRDLSELLKAAQDNLGYDIKGILSARIKEAIEQIQVDGSAVTVESAIKAFRDAVGVADGSKAVEWVKDTLNKDNLGDSAEGASTLNRITGAKKHVGAPPKVVSADVTDPDLNIRANQAKLDLKAGATSVTAATKAISELVKEDATEEGKATLHAQVTEQTSFLDADGDNIAAKIQDIGKKLDNIAADATAHIEQKAQDIGLLVDGAAVAADADENLKKKVQDIGGLLDDSLATSDVHVEKKIQTIGDIIDFGTVEDTDAGNLTKKVQDLSQMIHGSVASGEDAVNSIMGGTTGQLHVVAKLVDNAEATVDAGGSVKEKLDGVLARLQAFSGGTMTAIPGDIATDDNLAAALARLEGVFVAAP